MADPIRRFAAVFDLHWGYESSNGHKKPLHDLRAWNTTLQFLSDFKPHDFFFGGDILDCGVISHWNKDKPRKTEGFRLLRDAEECRVQAIEAVSALLPPGGRRVFLQGNHEAWIDQLLDRDPGLEGLFDIKSLLCLQKWEVIDQGRGASYGKLYFLHGDTIKGGEHIAKAGVITYERNVRFGHHHTYQTYTKTSPIDIKLPKTGIAVPCLCSKDVDFMKRTPNKWVQGFLWGYATPTGPFTDHVAVIVNGQLVENGKVYRG